MSKSIAHEKFVELAKKHILKHYGSFSECSLKFGDANNYMTRCFSRKRHFPKELLEEMGYGMEKANLYYRLTEEDK